MLKSGRLSHRVTIESPTYTQDSYGDPTPDWVTVAEVWAAIEPLSVREFMAAQSEQSKVSARITIRHRSDLSADMRILHNGKIYNIEGILPDPDSGLEYVTLPCSQGVRA